MVCSERIAVLIIAFWLSLNAAWAQQGPLLSGTSAADFTTPPTSCDVAVIGGGPGDFDAMAPYNRHRALHSSFHGMNVAEMRYRQSMNHAAMNHFACCGIDSTISHSTTYSSVTDDPFSTASTVIGVILPCYVMQVACMPRTGCWRAALCPTTTPASCRCACSRPPAGSAAGEDSRRVFRVQYVESRRQTVRGSCIAGTP